MSDFWLSVVSGIASGVATSLLWAFALYVYSRHRNRTIEKAMERQFYPDTFSQNLNGWGMVIKNDTGTEVTVREFALVGVPLHGQGSSTITFSLEPRFSDKAVKGTGDGWAIMPPFTAATFNAPSADYVQRSGLLGRLQGARITIEYRNLIGTNKLVTIMPPFESERQRDLARSFTEILTQVGPPQQGGLPS